MKDRYSNSHPPTWAQRLLRALCSTEALEEIEGDLLEEYRYQLRINGPRTAYWNYVVNVITCSRPLAVRSHSTYQTSRLPLNVMWRNYLTTAVRNFGRNKLYSFLNLAGLTLGLVCSMLIFQYVMSENSADSFHKKQDRLHRVAFNLVTNGGTPEIFSQIFLGAGEAFKNEIPAISNVARVRADFFQEGPTITYIDADEKTAFKDVRSIIVDSTFLNMFTFPVAKGDEQTALTSPGAVVITETMAQRIFGSTDPIGKTIEYSMNQGVQNLQVTAVVKDVPANSHIQFDVMIPLRDYLRSIPEKQKQFYNDWDFREFTTYVELPSEANISDLEATMTQIVNRHMDEDLRKRNANVSVHLQAMKSVYFDRETDLGLTGFGSALVATRTGNERMVYFFTIIAIITLTIALMSYVNLSTVRSLDRAKEIGVRKVIGAYRYDLKVQFFLESLLMNLAALIIAVVMILLLMQPFNAFVETNFTWASWFNRQFLLVFGTVFVSGVLLSGLYPAFVLSSFIPIEVLKGKMNSPASRSQVRKVFVVLQYAPAIALLICTIIVYSQLNFMRNMDVGLNMDQLITIRSPRFLPDGLRSFEAEAMFKNEIKTLSTVEGVSFAGNQAGRGLNFLVPFVVDSANDAGILQFKGTGVDHDFAKVFGLKLVAGEPFTEGMNPMYGEPNQFIRKVLVNETAVRTWNFKRNADAVGRMITSADGTRYFVQGVLEDFNWASVHNVTDPVMLWYTPNNRFMTIKLSSGTNFENSLAQIKGVYDKLFPTDVFHFEFADDVYNRQYGEDQKFANLFGLFSGMAILIASLGLFGLSAFTAERRSKEVSIRKVMGANVSQIVRLLSKEFLLLVGIAFIIASPVAWFVMEEWLKTFAFRVDLNAFPFLITAIGSLLIAAVTLSLRAVGVANSNPVKTLRME